MKKTAMAVLISSSLLSASLSWAAENPSGPSTGTSEGSFDITLFNETKIQLYGLVDVELKADTAVPYTSTTPVCVAANIGNYEMSLASSSDFNLNPSAVNTGDDNGPVPYTLQLLDDSATVADGLWGAGGLASEQYSPTPLAADQNVDFSAAIDTACIGDNYAIQVAANTAGATFDTGSYTDTVTVVVSPL